MKTQHDWSRLDAMTEEQRRAAALADPGRAAPVGRRHGSHRADAASPQIIRRALGLTQEQFAASYQIPLGTLRDWEQGAKQPDQAARAYLRAIASDPVGVERAL